ncbi:MAG: hypothetical protein PHN84_11920 [Desulfuromonadaceae bacterium]|nr:hypothetical protein [Desulfuromonadaceae bacterium]MDD2855896.1 hypothetical protein [Desulfuromonadaceae bacterium]
MIKNKQQLPIPLSSSQILDMSFLENRARLLEIAAFIDRIERSADPDTGKADFRYKSFIEGVRLLLDDSAAVKTSRIQINFSDPTTEPIASAIKLKAHGAWSGETNEGY